MKFQDLDGEWKSFDSSFSQCDLVDLKRFVKSHTHNLTMGELVKADEFDVPVTIRHDVDHSLKHALRFAKWEHEREIRSTYFVLHTAYYYRDKPALFSQMRELEAMGHEVGLHIDTVSQNLVVIDGRRVPDYPAAADHLGIELAELRHEGFDIRGVAAHAGHKEFTDEELIKIYGTEFFNLEYEAYQVNRKLNVNYVSDNQGQWRSPLVKIDSKPTIISTHPCHWPF